MKGRGACASRRDCVRPPCSVETHGYSSQWKTFRLWSVSGCARQHHTTGDEFQGGQCAPKVHLTCVQGR